MPTEEELEYRKVPMSSLDFNLMTTDSVWGKDEIGKDLRQMLKTKQLTQRQMHDTNGKPVFDEEGNPILVFVQVEDVDLWHNLAFFSRDFRLANLSMMTGDLPHCEHFSVLAGDLLSEPEIDKECFTICLSRATARLELSQSRGGFLRRRLGTFSKENIIKEQELPKRTFMGKKMEEN